MHFKKILLASGLAASALLTGCAHMVSFDSEPAGAAVSYNGATIGTTPFKLKVSDQFGWFSVYTFTATLDGYAPATQTYSEKLPTDAVGVVPDHVHFDLQKQ